MAWAGVISSSCPGQPGASFSDFLPHCVAFPLIYSPCSCQNNFSCNHSGRAGSLRPEAPRSGPFWLPPPLPEGKVSTQEGPAPPGSTCVHARGRTHTHTHTHASTHTPAPLQAFLGSCGPRGRPPAPRVVSSGFRGLLVGPDFSQFPLQLRFPQGFLHFPEQSPQFWTHHCVFFSSRASQIEYASSPTKPGSCPSRMCVQLPRSMAWRRWVR